MTFASTTQRAMFENHHRGPTQVIRLPLQTRTQGRSATRGRRTRNKSTRNTADPSDHSVTLPNNEEPGLAPRGVGWRHDEHERFLHGLEMFPRGPWKEIARVVGTRTVRQTMTHAQKYRQKIERRRRGLQSDRIYSVLAMNEQWPLASLLAGGAAVIPSQLHVQHTGVMVTPPLYAGMHPWYCLHGSGVQQVFPVSHHQRIHPHPQLQHVDAQSSESLASLLCSEDEETELDEVEGGVGNGASVDAMEVGNSVHVLHGDHTDVETSYHTILQALDQDDTVDTAEGDHVCAVIEPPAPL